MFASAMRSVVMVNDEMPTSYLLPSAGMIAGKSADSITTSSPRTAPTAVMMSMS
ncbi:hypothetical protein D3C74_432590 [compost metagenome]